MVTFNDQRYEKPNWREAFEQVLAKGGVVSGETQDCGFCKIEDSLPACINSCPLYPQAVSSCATIFVNAIDNSERRAICRYVLEVGGDFIDYDEARLLIGTALTILGKDDAREKFLGKAEKAPESYGRFELEVCYSRPATRKVHRGECPELEFTITEGQEELHTDYIIAAFKCRNTRDRVLEFLNKGEA